MIAEQVLFLKSGSSVSKAKAQREKARVLFVSQLDRAVCPEEVHLHDF